MRRLMLALLFVATSLSPVAGLDLDVLLPVDTGARQREKINDNFGKVEAGVLGSASADHTHAGVYEPVGALRPGDNADETLTFSRSEADTGTVNVSGAGTATANGTYTLTSGTLAGGDARFDHTGNDNFIYSQVSGGDPDWTWLQLEDAIEDDVVYEAFYLTASFPGWSELQWGTVWPGEAPAPTTAAGTTEVSATLSADGLAVDGAIRGKVTTVTAATKTLSQADGNTILGDTTSNAVALTLPDANTVIGLKFRIFFIADGGNALTVATDGTDTLNAAGNKLATFDDAEDLFIIEAVSANRWVIWQNVGGTLSTP